MLDLEPADAGRSTSSFAGHPDDRLFRVHFDNLPRPAYIWRRDAQRNEWVLIAYNNAAGALRFSNVGVLVGRTATDLQRGATHDLHGDLEQCAEHGTVGRRETDYRYIATGTVRTLAVTLVPLSKDVVVQHTEDVTERRSTEQALRDGEAKYRTIVDTAHEGIVSVDLASTINYANQRAAVMLGYEPAECVGRTTFEFMESSVHDQARRIRERLHNGSKERQDIRLRHRSGHAVWVSAAATPLLDPAGKDINSGCNIDGVGYIDRTELKADGQYKARYVVGGHRQKKRVDYGEIFVTVARSGTIRIFVALIAIHGLSTAQLDVLNAFLNSKLTETVYV